VLFLGRVTFQKGPDYFVEAARWVLSRRPDVLFVLAGYGDMRPRLMEHVAGLEMGAGGGFARDGTKSLGTEGILNWLIR